MPRVGQIVPEYLVPHVKTYINDNTVFTETTGESETGTRLLCLFASDKGCSTMAKQLKSLPAFVSEYGNPNFEKYGQAAFIPYNALSTGNARCWCLRVTDLEKATHANVIVYAEISVVESEFTVKFTTESVANIRTTVANSGSTDTYMDQLRTYMGNSETETKIPLFGICVTGSGEYGNAYGIRIVKDNMTSQYLSYGVYRFEIFDKSSGAVVVSEAFNVSFNERAEPDYTYDVINDPDNGSEKIFIEINQKGFDKLYEAYANTVTDKTQLETYDYCDMLYGTRIGTNVSLVNYKVVSDETTANFSGALGISFAKGDDGRFSPNFVKDDGTVITEEERQKVITDAYLRILEVPEVLSDAVIPEIFSKRRTPAEFILDAGFPDEIKVALSALALYRYDAQLILDAGTKFRTVTALLNYVTNGPCSKQTDAIISKECQFYNTRDPITKKIITVTYTYHLAQALTSHFTNIGNHIPFVGENYATLTGHIVNSVTPEIDADDLETKEQLYTKGVNFLECISENTYIHATQATSQCVNTWSDLSEMNNVAVLLDMKRQIERFVSSRLYNFADPEDRLRFTEDADRLFKEYSPTKVREYNVYFDMNAFEAERNIIHCYLAVTFRQLAKRGIIEIDINKRTS